MIDSGHSDRCVVVLGGTAEARILAHRLGKLAHVVLAVPERVQHGWPCPVTLDRLNADLVRRFGGCAIVDASHPFDSANAAAAMRAASLTGVPLLRLERAGWRAGRSDQWVWLRREQDAAQAIPSGARVLASTGRDGLCHLTCLRHHMVFARRIGPVNSRFPLARGRFLTGDPPFSVTDEARLLRHLRITWLLARDAGGPGGWPKLAAARQLGLPVAMIRRPHRVPAHTVRDVANAEEWARQWL